MKHIKTLNTRTLQNTLKKVSNAKTKVVGFVQTVKKVVESVKSFLDKIGALFK